MTEATKAIVVLHLAYEVFVLIGALARGSRRDISLAVTFAQVRDVGLLLIVSAYRFALGTFATYISLEAFPTASSCLDSSFADSARPLRCGAWIRGRGFGMLICSISLSFFWMS